MGRFISRTLRALGHARRAEVFGARRRGGLTKMIHHLQVLR